MVELLVVIPVYNEAHRIEGNTIKIINFLEKKRVDYEIVLAVDPSPDKSEVICQKLEERFDKVYAVISQKKEGRGLAVRSAWNHHRASVYSFIDADLSVGIEPLYDGYVMIKDGITNFVIGSRYSAGSKTKRPPLRKAVSFSYNLLLQRIFKNDIKDYQCGLKIMSSDVVNTVISLSRVKSWFWDAEIIIIALNKGYKVYQLPVVWSEKKHTRTSLKRLAHDMILHGWGILLLYKRIRQDHIALKPRNMESVLQIQEDGFKKY